jgi:hypothetical protein
VRPGEGALGLAAGSSSYELAQGLAAEGCGGLLEVALLLGDPDLDPAGLGRWAGGHQQSVRRPSGQIQVLRTAPAVRNGARYAAGLDDRKMAAEGRNMAQESQLEPVSPMKSRRFRTLRLRRDCGRKRQKDCVSRSDVLVCSWLFPARGTAKGPQRRAKGTAGDTLRGFTPEVQALRTPGRATALSFAQRAYALREGSCS